MVSKLGQIRVAKEALLKEKLEAEDIRVINEAFSKRRSQVVRLVGRMKDQEGASKILLTQLALEQANKTFQTVIIEAILELNAPSQEMISLFKKVFKELNEICFSKNQEKHPWFEYNRGLPLSRKLYRIWNHASKSKLWCESLGDIALDNLTQEFVHKTFRCLHEQNKSRACLFGKTSPDLITKLIEIENQLANGFLNDFYLCLEWALKNCEIESENLQIILKYFLPKLKSEYHWDRWVAARILRKYGHLIKE
jgi:hypothetical protein